MKKPPAIKRHHCINPILNVLFLVLFLLGLHGVQTAQGQSFALTNLWTLTPKTNTFLNPTDNLTRGLAYNPVTGHVLLASRSQVIDFGTNVFGTNAIVTLDQNTGAVLGKLPYDSTVITQGTFVINMVGVTDDGVIYVCNLTTDSTNTATPLKLYRWANETAQPQLVYSGAPSGNDPTANNRRFGDSMSVRGTGANTQIILGSIHTNLARLTTTDGINFTAQKIATDAAAGDFRYGLAWGAGDTFWAKQNGGNLKKFSLNVGAGTATTVTNFAMTTVPGGPLDVDVTRNLVAIAGIIGTTNHSLRLYDIIDTAAAQQQDTTRFFPTNNANGNLVGAVVLRDGKLFAMDVNNGVVAYTVNEVYLNPTIRTQPSSVSIWEGAEWWTFSVVAAGNRGETLGYQWRFAGTNISGATSTSLTLSNIAIANQGSYTVVVSNISGTATSSAAVMTVYTSNPTDQMTNIWNVAPNTRPYMTSGYKEYGVAINPLNNNVIVLTRPNPTNMLVVLDLFTGTEKNYINYAALGVSSGWNKVDVGDDGIVYLCNMTGETKTTPFTITGLSDDGPTPSFGGTLYSGDPGNGLTATTNYWGRTFAVRGGGLDTQILVAGGLNTNTWVAILTNYNTVLPPLFGARPIVVTNAPGGFARLGLDWGPGTNTFWAKTASGSLILVEFDFAAGTGFVKKTYPMTGSRSVPGSVTGIKYDSTFNLVAGLQNGSPPTPVSVPVYDVSNLDAGPFWTDHELFSSYNADVEFQGNVDFGSGYLVALGVNNGLKAFRVNASFAGNRAVIVTQPSGGTWFEGTSPTISVVADANSALSYQWYYYATQLVSGATSASLTLTNIEASQAGDYMVRVTTAGGSIDSRAATIATMPVYSTPQMSNIWSVAAGSRTYLHNNYFEYGIAFNPVNSNVLVASWVSTNTPKSAIGVMDGLTGAHKHTLDVSAVSNAANREVNRVGVADDGVVYIGNRTTSPATVPFVLYRWANDEPTTVATVAYTGDPAPSVSSKTVGYTMDVRGSGASTEVLLGLNSTNVVCILTTADGTNFTAKQILVAGAPTQFARLGICWGAGNTFWAKTWKNDTGGGLLRLVQYDLVAGTGSVLQTYSTAQVASTMTTIAYNDGLKFLAGIARDDQENVLLYTVADLAYGPVLLDQELFPTYNPSIEANGALDFGGNSYVYALDENNGVMAFQINSSYVPPVTHFKVLSVTPSGADVVLTWQAQSGTTYQVQYADELGATARTNWTTLGSVTATGSTASFTNAAAASKRFYQVITP